MIINIFHSKMIVKNFENLSKYEKKFSKIQVFDRCQEKVTHFELLDDY
jgi:hypothetical protein